MKHFTKNLRWLLASLLLAVGASSAWGDTYTLGWGSASGSNYTNFTTTSGTVSGVLSFSTAKNSGTSDPAYNANNKDLRLYYHSGGNGGSITLTPAENITITDIVMTTSTTPSVNYSVDGGTATSVTQTNKVYTISGISATQSVTIQNVNTSNTQLRIKTIEVTYTSSSSSTAALTTTTIDASGITNTNLANGTAAGSLSATVTSGGNAVSGATVSWSSSDTSVATINSSGVVTLGGAGTTDITASYAGVTDEYEASSDTYTLNVSNFTIEDGKFYFDKSNYGSGVTAGTSQVTTTSTWTAVNVTLTASGNYCWYNGEELRIYSGGTFVLEGPSGSVITQVELAGSMTKANIEGSAIGNNTNYTWTGEANTVTITRNTGTAKFTSIIVTYSTSSKTATSLSWSAATATVTMGETNTFPTLTTDPAGLTGVTYSSSDTSVATVASDGTITLVAAGTTTITASYAGDDTYLAADDASYTLTVNPAAGTQPMEVTIGLNNTTYGTSYNGSITGSVTASGTISNVTVTYDKGTSSNAYINDSQTRIYSGNTLTFTAPSGYKITNIAFSGSNWQTDFEGDTGSYDTSTHEWTGDAATVVFTRTTNGNMQLTQAVITLGTDIPNCVSDLTFTPTALNLNATGTFTPSATEESSAGTIEYSFSCETEGLSVDSNGAYTASAAGTYNVTVTATPSSSSYRAVSQVVEVTVTDPRAETTTTFPEATYSVELGGTFTAPTATVSANGSAISGATVTYSSSNNGVAQVNATTGAVTIIDAGSATITATYEGDASNYKGSEGSYVLNVSDPNQTDFTWDLTIASYDANPTVTTVVWSNEVATMTGYQANGGQSGYTAANNYLGGDSNNRTSSRFYTHETLTISPTDGNTITSIVFTAMSEGYATALANSTWTNASVTVSETTVTVTPTDGTADIVADITGTCGFSGVTVNYTSASTVAKPMISPVTGNYAVRPQTVTITCETDGATIYYTTDGTVPTTSSTQYTGSFTITRNMTIMAIAVKDGNTSRTATSEITFTVNPPVFTPATGASFSDTYNVSISADAGLTIYYIAQDNKIFQTAAGGKTATYSESNGELVSNAQVYSSALTFGQSMMVTAICMDADGNLSDPVTAQYTFSGSVVPPYYSSFSASEGDFSNSNATDANTITANGAPEWTMNSNTGASAIATWGEERYYMFVRGTSGNTNQSRTRWYGTADLTSPLINLTGKGNASFSFIHAGHHFYSDPNTSATATSNSYETTLSASTAGSPVRTSCHVYIDDYGTDGSSLVSSTDVSDDVTWFEQAFRSDIANSSNPKTLASSSTTSRSGSFPRSNSGDISLSGYENHYIKIRFSYTSNSESYGTWNIDQVTVNAVDVEEMTMNNKGWTTYVFDHDIDAYTTTQNYISGGEETLKIYKVTEFDFDEVVLQQLGKFEEYTDANNSERYIPAKTPVVIEGPAGATIDFVEYNAPSMLPTVKHNLLYASLNPNLVTATEETRYYVLQWNTKTVQPWFNRLTTGRSVPDHKAFLNGVDEIEQVSTKTNSVKGIYVLGGDGEDEATGIEDINITQKAVEDNVFYNIAGQRVVNPTRGLYIVNGKKVYLK